MGKVIGLFDSLRNAITGAGSSRDARTAYAYAGRTLTQVEISAAYSGSGLMRKIIQIPALDMVREWRDWKLAADKITLVEAEEKRHSLRQKIRTAETLRGLGGGALILGLPGDPATPAPAATKGALAFVHVVSRWHLTFDTLQMDARDPGYGEPLMWKMQQDRGGQIEIHPSRVITFRADTAATLASINGANSADAFWGESTVQQVLDAVTDSDAARASFAALLHKARLLRVGIPGLSGTLSMPGGQAAVQARLEVLGLAESIFNTTIFDAGTDGKSGEVITDAAYDFTGAKDMMNSFAEFVSAISDIPATRLLGRAAEGMNSSGDSQQTDWRKKVRAMQTLDLAPCLDRLDAFLVPSALGSMPDGQWYDFAPLDTPSEKENAERWKVQMDAINILANTGTIPERALTRGVQSLMIDEGYLPELETALSEIPEEERWGIEAMPDPNKDPLLDPKGGDPFSPAAGDPSEEA